MYFVMVLGTFLLLHMALMVGNATANSTARFILSYDVGNDFR